MKKVEAVVRHFKLEDIKNTSFKSIEQISKDMALSAAKASGTGEKQKSQEDFMADLSKMVEDIASGKSTSQLGAFVEKCVTHLEKIKEAVETLAKTRDKFVGATTKIANNTPGGRIINRLVGLGG